MGSLLTFPKVLEQVTTPHLLLGNGFSMSYDKNRFSFTSLLDSAVNDGILDKDSKIYKLFTDLATADFENVMRLLDDSQKVVAVYSDDDKLLKEIMLDSANLKEYLVKIITNNHPEKSTSIPETQKLKCVEFLKNFKDIYSLNYDLLLYWATMQDNSTSFTDGFANSEDSVHEGFVVYQNSSGFKVHYLHGALHIFDAGDEIIKKTYANTDVNLVEQIRESLNRHVYPIFISEGNSSQKLTKILHSAYLNHCYKSFRKIGGDLVIYGASLKDNDEHILNAIFENKVQNVYLGVSAEHSATSIMLKFDEYNSSAEKKHQKKLFLYDYRTINIWGNNEQ